MNGNWNLDAFCVCSQDVDGMACDFIKPFKAGKPDTSRVCIAEEDGRLVNVACCCRAPGSEQVPVVLVVLLKVLLPCACSF